MDNGSDESVGGFKCGELDKGYKGVNRIFKISKDGKSDRVGLDYVENAKQIKELF